MCRNWTLTPIGNLDQLGALISSVVEQDLEIITITAPDKSSIGDSAEELTPSAIAAGFFFDGCHNNSGNNKAQAAH